MPHLLRTKRGLTETETEHPPAERGIKTKDQIDAQAKLFQEGFLDNLFRLIIAFTAAGTQSPNYSSSDDGDHALHRKS
jgi:hypothetical protein